MKIFRVRIRYYFSSFIFVPRLVFVEVIFETAQIVHSVYRPAVLMEESENDLEGKTTFRFQNNVDIPVSCQVMYAKEGAVQIDVAVTLMTVVPSATTCNYHIYRLVRYSLASWLV